MFLTRHPTHFLAQVYHVLTLETFLTQEVRDWLRKPENRNRYLDDLVWLIHDRFGIVCSTTTMSKMKRKWLRVIEYEETGRPIDDTTRQALYETHPDLPLLHDEAGMPSPEDFQHHHPAPPAMMQPPPEAMMHHQQVLPPQQEMPIPIEPQIDQQLEQQIQREIATADAPRA